MSDTEKPTPDDGASNAALGSSLCMRCGLCCMGVIHNNAVLDEDEVPSATALGLSVSGKERPLFALPCPHLAGTICSVYDRRPRVCGRYRCKLLRGVDSEDISVEGALEHVERAKSMLAQVRSAMPEAMTLKDARTLLRDEVPTAATFAGLADREVSRLKLLVTALHLYLDRHFRHEDENLAIDMQPMRPDRKEEG